MALETSQDMEERVESLHYDCEVGTTTVEVTNRRCGVFGEGNELLFFFLLLVVLYNRLYYTY